MISRHVIYCDQYPDGAVEAGSNARERKSATVSHEYLLVAIDVLSKYTWVSPMKDKTGKGLIAAFNSILKKGRKPEKLRMDKGTEFVNVFFRII